MNSPRKLLFALGAGVLVASLPSFAGPAQDLSAEQQTVSADALYKQGLELETGGDVRGAVMLYRRAVRQGNSPAALRLCEIYKSVNSEFNAYQEYLMWCAKARSLGAAVPLEKGPR